MNGEDFACIILFAVAVILVSIIVGFILYSVGYGLFGVDETIQISDKYTDLRDQTTVYHVVDSQFREHTIYVPSGNNMAGGASGKIYSQLEIGKCYSVHYKKWDNTITIVYGERSC